MFRITIKNNSIIALLCSMYLLVSCDAKQVFDHYTVVPKNSWNKNDIIVFSFAIQDTITKNNLFIHIRNNKEYPFSNLFLITSMKFPNGQKIVDTLEYDMADATGKFLGRGFSDIKENKLLYKEHITFPISGAYTLEVQQAMRKNNEIDGVLSLGGVTDVGFRIEKQQ